jgi:CheY-like chemotaxis protein
MPKKSVLLVEDDPDTRLIYGTILRSAGYEVVEARDGREGVSAAHAHHPDVIIMNLVLPEVDGISASTMIKGDAGTSSIPIIVCTAFLQAEGDLIAQEAGCDVYLEKPCSPTRLVEEVRRMIGDEVPEPIPAGGT